MATLGGYCSPGLKPEIVYGYKRPTRNKPPSCRSRAAKAHRRRLSGAWRRKNSASLGHFEFWLPEYKVVRWTRKEVSNGQT